MIKVKAVYPYKWNNQCDTEAVNAILRKTPGINFPGLYDNFFIGIQVEMSTVDLINRLNFEQNILFKETHNSYKKEVFISIAEAISIIYELTILPIQRQRLSNSLTSVDSVIDLLKFYLIDNHAQCITKVMNMIMPDNNYSWMAYIETKPYLDRFNKLISVQKGKSIFTDIQYSSVPIKTWFDDTQELLDIVDHIEDYRCIETIYFKGDDNSVIEKLISIPYYKIIMNGKYESFNTVTLLVSDKPIKEDIELIKESYKDFYKN